MHADWAGWLPAPQSLLWPVETINWCQIELHALKCAPCKHVSVIAQHHEMHALARAQQATNLSCAVFLKVFSHVVVAPQRCTYVVGESNRCCGVNHDADTL